jgi:hypothetical protein
LSTAHASIDVSVIGLLGLLWGATTGSSGRHQDFGGSDDLAEPHLGIGKENMPVFGLTYSSLSMPA